MINTIGVENNSQEIITSRKPKSDELLMNERRPTPHYVAKSNGDGTGFWFDNSDVINAELAQENMQEELAWVDLQLKYHATSDSSRSVSTVEALNNYAIQCRDYVRNIDGVLTIVGDKPTRPE